MTKYAISITAVMSIVLLGLQVDRQSRGLPEHSEGIDLSGSAIFCSGRVEGAGEEIELRPQLAGRVAEVLVEQGSHVTAGDVLLMLDDRQYGHEVALAEAQLRQAQAQFERLENGARREERTEAEAMWKMKDAELERARLQWDRIRQLRLQNAVTQQEADDKRTEVAALEAAVEAARARWELLNASAREDDLGVARATVAAAQAKLEIAQLQWSRAQLLAPVSGQVLAVHAKVGELVGPESSQPAIVMADTTRFRVRAFVEEYDAPRLQVGMQARVTADGLSDVTLRGTLTRLSPRMHRKQHWTDAPDEQFDTKTREVWIDLDADSLPSQMPDLVVGLRVDVMILTDP